MTSPSYVDLELPGIAEDALAQFDRAEIAGTLEAWARKWGRGACISAREMRDSLEALNESGDDQ